MAIPWVLYGSGAQLTRKTLGRYVFRLVHTTAHAVQYQVAKRHRALRHVSRWVARKINYYRNQMSGLSASFTASEIKLNHNATRYKSTLSTNSPFTPQRVEQLNPDISYNVQCLTQRTVSQLLINVYSLSGPFTQPNQYTHSGRRKNGRLRTKTTIIPARPFTWPLYVRR